MGGLINEEQEEQESSVPFFGDLPLIGWMFRYVKTSTTKKNLVLFLRPTIIVDNTIASSISYGKYNSLRSKQLMMGESNSFDADLAPLLQSLGLNDDEIDYHINDIKKVQSNSLEGQDVLLEKNNDRIDTLKEAVKKIQGLE